MTCPFTSSEGFRCTRPAAHPSNCFAQANGAVVVWNLSRADRKARK